MQYHHIINPATGRPAESGLGSVTAIGKESYGYALSTALFVMGSEDAIAYWKQYSVFEMILLTDKDEIYITERLENRFILQEEYDSYPITVVRT